MNVELLNTTINDFNNIPYVLFTIEGHGFMYHQIRKMVGLIIQVINQHLKEQEFNNVFQEQKIDIWLAPGAGLFLKKVISFLN